MAQYDSRTDLILHSLANAGWLEDHTGMEEAPTGLVYLLHLTAQGLGETYLQKIDKLPNVNRNDIIGDFLVTEDDMGAVQVTKFANQHDAAQAFATAQQAFLAWS